MSSTAAAAHTGPPEPIPAFPIPELSLFAVEALRAAGLDKFYDRNEEEFTKLVCVMYAAFMNHTKDLRKRKPAPKKMFSLFCAPIKMVLTAPRPQRESLQIAKTESVNENGLACEFLWSHLRKEGVLAWQDFYGESKQKNSKAVRLVDDFVHFVVARTFAQQEKTTFYLSDESNLQEARRVIQDINRGARKLKPL